MSHFCLPQLPPHVREVKSIELVKSYRSTSVFLYRRIIIDVGQSQPVVAARRLGFYPKNNCSCFLYFWWILPTIICREKNKNKSLFFFLHKQKTIKKKQASALAYTHTPPILCPCYIHIIAAEWNAMFRVVLVKALFSCIYIAAENKELACFFLLFHPLVFIFRVCCRSAYGLTLCGCAGVCAYIFATI